MLKQALLMLIHLFCVCRPYVCWVEVQAQAKALEAVGDSNASQVSNMFKSWVQKVFLMFVVSFRPNQSSQEFFVVRDCWSSASLV